MPDIRHRVSLPDHAVLAHLDATMINQALTNLLKNAAEAIEERLAADPETLGEIRVTLTSAPESLAIDIQDNGTGLPDQPARLFEPYVTHRAKGTGLGLPIVKKIVEEHDGTLELMPAPPFDGSARPGAWARIVLPQALPEREWPADAESPDHREAEREHAMTDILVVDDERDIRALIGDILEDEGHGVRMAWDSDTALGEINKAAPDLVILDIWLKDSRLDGIDILKRVRRDNPAVPVVIISGHGNIEIAVAAIKQGAYDFIEKPFNIDQLLVVITRALETSRLRRENATLKGRESAGHAMIGTSPAFRHMKHQLDRVARTNSRVMLAGPAGAGKEVASRYIHRNSERAKGPFVVVNSAAIGAEQMEEVLFGRESAERGVEPGLFERAHTGLLFFDEVADMPPGTQSKILRVLVDQAFQRVGGTDTVRVDVRVVSATTRDLAREVQAGRFRTELFHRLNVVPVHGAGARGAPRGHPRAGEALPGGAERAAGPAAPAADAGGGGAAADDALAGQRAAAPQHARARGDPRPRARRRSSRRSWWRSAPERLRRRGACSARPSPGWRCARRARCSSGNT